VLLSCVGFSFLISVYGFYISERETNPEIWDFGTSCAFMGTTMTTVGNTPITPVSFLGRTFAMTGAVSAMLCIALTSALLSKFAELKFHEQVALGWSYRKDVKPLDRECASILIQRAWRLKKRGLLRWARRPNLEESDAQGLSEALRNNKALRIRRLESNVSGEGGFSLMLDKVKVAENDMHCHFDAVEAAMDGALEATLNPNLNSNPDTNQNIVILSLFLIL